MGVHAAKDRSSNVMRHQRSLSVRRAAGALVDRETGCFAWWCILCACHRPAGYGVYGALPCDNALDKQGMLAYTSLGAWESLISFETAARR